MWRTDAVNADAEGEKIYEYENRFILQAVITLNI